ncbi:MAG: Gfo/Idh/MocA family oxidoreductase [Proteobacteria bacterium]|nr:Gfo/Idh/MocA family oxidoreductase [Pseudomonadota bacterium]
MAMRIAVIGAGSIGKRHHGNLEALGAEAVLIPWRDYRGPAQLQGCDGVVVATATQVRLPVIADAAGLGLPFYVEKPLAYDPAELSAIEAVAAPVAARSMLGYMMRYHPAFRFLAAMDLADIYRARFEIGHDVRQWRQNWRFADSYAAKAEGGGVLLDLCHELDMAATLFPGLALDGVKSLGHAAYPSVDFSDEILLSGDGPLTTVTMDYLSPVFLRRLTLRGTRHTVEFDIHTGNYMIADVGNWRQVAMPFERNDMFLAAMRDFLALIAGKPTSDVEHLPRFDLALPSARMIVEAYQARDFVGEVVGDY